jgi:type II restriction/modification system DNA methylase subunit YeeA
MSATRESLVNFVSYCQQHIKGDEKSESQLFLIEFFRAFGHNHTDFKKIGVEFESRLKKGSATGKTGFADLVWRSYKGLRDTILAPGVVIEMKSRGVDLSKPKHYQQLERYWVHIVPNRPQYAILCNFDEFWIFDFENQVDDPLEVVNLKDIPNKISTFSFMEVGGKKPIFRNNQVEVTESVATNVGKFYRLLRERGKSEKFKNFSKEDIQRFTLQCVLAMFSEDRGLLPNSIFTRLVRKCLNENNNSYDLFRNLFLEMNTQGITPDGECKGVDYFNGGLFSIIKPIQLTTDELSKLNSCASADWKNVRPSIFGSIFESAIDEDGNARRKHGIHYTSESDIRKIVRATILDYWEEKIEKAKTIADYISIQLEMQSYKVLDPSCGSGNFLYIAYQGLKEIEQNLVKKILERRKADGDKQQKMLSFITPLQFYGMDTNPFAIQLARVTMMIARKIAIDKHGLAENYLPLDTLDNNIVCKDALFSEWEKADAIIGNPPFIGGKLIRHHLGEDYIKKVFNTFPDVKDSVDFCCYWFRLAHDNLSNNGRAGLVGTNSISQGKSRVASLDYILNNGGYIHDAISTQEWSGEAKVHVSIVNWSKTKPLSSVLDGKIVDQVNSSLSDQTDVAFAKAIKANKGFSFQGINPVGKDFYISDQLVENWTKKDIKNINVLKRSISASNLTDHSDLSPSRSIIDFNDMSIEDASDYVLPFEHLRKYVKPLRDVNRRQSRKVNWWQFGEKCPEMRKSLVSLGCYFREFQASNANFQLRNK